MKFNVPVLALGLLILAINLILVTANSSDEPSASIESRTRVNRRTHCGVRTFKLLMLICTNDLKFPTVEREGLKDPNNDGQLLNYEPFIKRAQGPIQSSELLNDQQSFNLKKYVDFNNLQDSISDVHVHNNPNYHRMKRSLIRDCCHRACTLKELENLC